MFQLTNQSGPLVVNTPDVTSVLVTLLETMELVLAPMSSTIALAQIINLPIVNDGIVILVLVLVPFPTDLSVLQLIVFGDNGPTIPLVQELVVVVPKLGFDLSKSEPKMVVHNVLVEPPNHSLVIPSVVKGTALLEVGLPGPLVHNVITRPSLEPVLDLLLPVVVSLVLSLELNSLKTRLVIVSQLTVSEEMSVDLVIVPLMVLVDSELSLMKSLSLRSQLVLTALILMEPLGK